MARVFVSYSRDDRQIVRELVRFIEQHGHSVWWDRDVPVGSAYEERIERALNECDVVVVVWTRNSVGSPWVRSEAQEGISRNILVPVSLDDARPPMAFRSFETAQLIGWPEIENPIEQQKLALGIARATAGSREQNSATVVIRDDPTLSSRVAERLRRQLNLGTSDVGLRLERAITDLLVRTLNKTSTPRESLRDFTCDFARATGAQHAALEMQGESDVLFGSRDVGGAIVAMARNADEESPRARVFERPDPVVADIGLDWMLSVTAQGFVAVAGGYGPCPVDASTINRLTLVSSLSAAFYS